MTPIELHITAGSSAGRRLLLEQPSITIGRSFENDVVIDLPYVSRKHAELRFEQGEWMLINHSPNGTRLDRRWVHDEPWVIDGPARIGIGDETVVEAAPQPATTTHIDGEDASQADAAEDAAAMRRPGGGMSRRAKIWTGIGIYFVLMLGLIVFFATLEEQENNTALTRAPELSAAEIVDRVRREVEPRPADERRARQALAEARELFNRRDAEIDARYNALEAYRLAKSYMPGHELPEIDRRRYRLLESELGDAVAQQYERAYSLLRSRQYEEALSAFRQLQLLYPAGANDPLLENIDRHTAVARRAVEQQ